LVVKDPLYPFIPLVLLPVVGARGGGGALLSKNIIKEKGKTPPEAQHPTLSLL